MAPSAGLPIATIWRRNRIFRDDESSEIDWRGEGVLMVRAGAAVENVGLDAAGCAFLDACASGRTLAESAMAWLALNGAADLSDLMARLLGAGAFGRLEIRDEQTKEQPL